MWIDRAIENCYWLDGLSCDLNPTTIVIFHMVFSFLYRDYNPSETYRCLNRESSIPLASDTGAGPLGESPKSEVLSSGPEIATLPTDGDLGDESIVEKSKNTRYLWSGSRAALKPVMVSLRMTLPSS